MRICYFQEKKVKDFHNQYIPRILVLWIIFFFMFLGAASAQNLSDLRNLEVDKLSDAQIEQLIKRAEGSGMTTAQLEAMAREQGLSPIEANKLRQRILQLQDTVNPQSGISGSQQGRGAGDQTQNDLFDSLRRSDPYYDLTPYQKKIFGFKLFHNRELDFNPSLNIPRRRDI